jgi:hypothetical protein
MAVAYAMEEQGSRPTIQHVTPQTSDEIVVTGRRPEEAPEAVEDTVTSATIKSLGTNSIGELLARLRARYAGGELAIIVNGRRLASIDALSEFPPEALKQIDVLRPGSGSQFGYPATDRILNLVLRPTFSSVTVEGAASGPTEGGGRDGNIATRYARIRGDRRMNGSVVYRKAGGLREDERADPALAPGTAGDTVSARYRSLIPASRDLTATAGIALPVRAANLDFSATGGATETRALAGLFRTASDVTIGSEDVAAYVQQGRTKYLRGSATLGGPWRRLFWSILMNGDITRSDNETKRGRAVSPDPIDPPDRSQAALPLAPATMLTSSLSENLAIRALVNGPVARLPTGDIRVGSTVSASGNRFRNRVSGSPVDPVTVSSTLMNAQVNADIPIANRDVAALAWLGNVMLNVSAEYGKLSGFAGAPAAQATLNWAISRSVTLSYSRNYRRSPPVPAQLYAPVIALPGRLIYDERGGGITPVTLISGGNPDLAASSVTAETVRVYASSNGRGTRIAGGVSYSSNRTDTPTLSFGNPSIVLERLLPALFVRDADGRLIRFDARPFNAAAAETGRLTADTHLSGTFGGPSQNRSPGTGRNAAAAPIAWDLNATYEYAIRNRIILAGRSSSLDLLRTPLSLSPDALARHRATIQATLSAGSLGGSLSGSWRSGFRGSAFEDAASPVRFSPLTVINAEAYIDLGRSRDEANPASIRVRLGIDNLLNRRVRISGRGDASGQGVSGRLLDPLGRVIRLAVRKVF